MSFKLLKAAHDKLNRQLSPPAAVDPFTQLPLEIAEMIVGYLKFYELMSVLSERIAK
jgi:F-box/TPR repeat protein Pof3